MGFIFQMTIYGVVRVAVKIRLARHSLYLLELQRQLCRFVYVL